MEVLQSVSLLHSLDVFVEAVFARQFVRPGNEQKVRHQRAFKAIIPTSVAPLPGKVVDLLEVLKVAQHVRLEVRS